MCTGSSGRWIEEANVFQAGLKRPSSEPREQYESDSKRMSRSPLNLCADRSVHEHERYRNEWNAGQHYDQDYYRNNRTKSRTEYGVTKYQFNPTYNVSGYRYEGNQTTEQLDSRDTVRHRYSSDPQTVSTAQSTFDTLEYGNQALAYPPVAYDTTTSSPYSLGSYSVPDHQTHAYDTQTYSLTYPTISRDTYNSLSYHHGNVSSAQTHSFTADVRDTRGSSSTYQYFQRSGSNYSDGGYSHSTVQEARSQSRPLDSHR